MKEGFFLVLLHENKAIGLMNNSLAQLKVLASIIPCFTGTVVGLCNSMFSPLNVKFLD